MASKTKNAKVPSGFRLAQLRTVAARERDGARRSSAKVSPWLSSSRRRAKATFQPQILEKVVR
jgi:hypothetical protein